MKEKSPDSDPEKAIFGATLGSLEIEPSEKFWNSALDRIIDREIHRKAQQVRVWKTVALSLSGFLLLFFLHDLLWDSKFKKMETKIGKLQTSVNPLQQHPISLMSAPAAANISTGQGIVQDNSAIQSPATASGVSSVSGIKEHVVSNVGKLQVRRINSNFAARHPGKALGTAHHVLLPDSTVSEIGGVQVPIAKGRDLQLTLDKPKDTSTLASFQSNEVSVINAAPAERKNSGAAAPDSASVAAVPELQKSKSKFGHRISLSAFFAPAMDNDFLMDRQGESYDGYENITADDIRSKQSDVFAYNLGIRAGLDLSKRVTLYIGLYYNNFSYDINQTVLIAQEQENGIVGYSMVTSSGIVNVPYSGPPPQPGDSIKARGSSSRGYLCVPIQVSYSFYTRQKFRMGIIGGFSANIAVEQGTQLWWQNTLFQDGSVNVQTIEGLSRLSVAYTAGLQATYLLGKGFSVFFEPEVEGALSSINANTPIITYPYLFSAAAGLTYHL